MACGLKCLLQVRLEVLGALDAHRKADDVLRNAGVRPLVCAHRRVAHRGGMLDQALHPAQAFGKRKDARGPKELANLLFSAPQLEESSSAFLGLYQE